MHGETIISEAELRERLTSIYQSLERSWTSFQTELDTCLCLTNFCKSSFLWLIDWFCYIFSLNFQRKKWSWRLCGKIFWKESRQTKNIRILELNLVIWIKKYIFIVPNLYLVNIIVMQNFIITFIKNLSTSTRLEYNRKLIISYG